MFTPMLQADDITAFQILVVARSLCILSDGEYRTTIHQDNEIREVDNNRACRPSL